MPLRSTEGECAPYAELCEAKTFEFTSVGEATLKGFDAPVALFEVRA